MLAGNGFKRLVANSAARADIGCTSRSQRDWDLSALYIRHFHILLEIKPALAYASELA
jgi:hypothetical protein